jgi:uncharacterized protein (DUF58 family)
MFSLKFFSLISIIILLILFGTFLREPLFIISTLPLFSYLALSLIFSQGISEIKIKRENEESLIQEGNSFLINTLIENPSETSFLVLIDDLIHERLGLSEGSNVMLYELKGKEKLNMKYLVTPLDIGSFEVGPINIQIFDYLGNYFKAYTFDEKFKIKVYPYYEYFEKLNIKPKHLRFWPGESLSKRTGSGLEFFGISELLPGEYARRINWKATARTNKIMKNIYHAELGSDSLIIVDLRKINDIEINGFSLISYIKRAAILLSYNLLRERYKLGLLILGDSAYKVPSGFGKRQFDKILLVTLEAKSGSQVDIRLLNEYVKVMFPITTQIFIITPAIDLTVVYSIVELYFRGYQIVTVIPSPLPPLKLDEFKERLLKIERENIASLLRKYSMVVEWNLKDPLILEINKVAKIWNRYTR